MSEKHIGPLSCVRKAHRAPFWCQYGSLWGLVTGSKIKKSWNLEFLMIKIMRSKFYCTNLEQINSRKLLNLLFKHISPINDQQIAIIVSILFPMISICFFYDFHHFSAPSFSSSLSPSRKDQRGSPRTTEDLQGSPKDLKRIQESPKGLVGGYKYRKL